MAAAIVLGVFFIGTSDNNSKLIDIDSTGAIVAQNTAPAVQNAVQAPVEAEVESAEPKAPRQIAVEPLAEQPAEPVAEIAAETVAEQPVETVSKPEAKTVVPQVSEPEADPFAQMEFEDSRNSRRGNGVSLHLLGGASGNSASAGRLSQAAPGNYLQNGISETSKSSFGIPVIVGVGARYNLTEAISVGAGIDYALLTRSFEGRYNDGSSLQTGDFNHTVQYLGIPVDLFVTLVERNDIKLYSNVGAEVEKAISNKYRLLGTDTVVGDKVSGLQWSVGGGVGIEFAVGERIAIFAEPTFKYYFNCDQPKSIRTEKPFQMVLRTGLRFDI